MRQYKEINNVSKLDGSKISKNQKIFKGNYDEVYCGVFEGKSVAIKSYFRKDLKKSGDNFITELINYELIHSKIDAEHSSLFVELIGFTLNDIIDPFYGCILTKYYHLGDLSKYCKTLSNPAKFKNYGKFDDLKKKVLFDEIVQLVDLAKQIAQGFLFYHSY